MAASQQEHGEGKEGSAILATLLGCGLRRRELIALTLDHIQRREDHWAIVDLVGKGGHIRTVPMPDWVKQIIDGWLATVSIPIKASDPSQWKHCDLRAAEPNHRNIRQPES